MYYLTNTDLIPNDKRIELVEKINSIQVIDGWNKDRKRLGVIT